MAQPVLWRASQVKPRTQREEDERMNNNLIISQWLPEMMMVRDAVQWVALARVLPSKSRMVLRSDRVLIRMLACLTNYHLH